MNVRSIKQYVKRMEKKELESIEYEYVPRSICSTSDDRAYVRSVGRFRTTWTAWHRAPADVLPVQQTPAAHCILTTAICKVAHMVCDGGRISHAAGVRVDRWHSSNTFWRLRALRVREGNLHRRRTANEGDDDLQEYGNPSTSN